MYIVVSILEMILLEIQPQFDPMEDVVLSRESKIREIMRSSV